MARVALTNQEVARILAAPKAISQDINWQPKARTWVASELVVENQMRLTLTFTQMRTWLTERNIHSL